MISTDNKTAAAESLSGDRLRWFTISHNLENHPMKKTNDATKSMYCAALQHLAGLISPDAEFVQARLVRFRDAFCGEQLNPDKTDEHYAMKAIADSKLRPWRRKFVFCLFCDIVLLQAHKEAFEKAKDILVEYLSNRNAALLERLRNLIFSTENIPRKYKFTEALITQCRENLTFASKPEKRFLVAANISAGKSTLINALVGKPVTRTSADACTSKLSFICNKPFDDNAVHLYNNAFEIKASYEDMRLGGAAQHTNIAAYFNAFVKPINRVCVIDTLGANNAINSEHGQLAISAIKKQRFDKLIYVFDANYLETSDDFQYLKLIAENVPKDKLIFALNKLDGFNDDESIEASVATATSVVVKLGYTNPIICPISARFAFLLKLKRQGETLTRSNTNEYNNLAQKLSEPEYDLSRYYSNPGVTAQDEHTDLAAKCGLMGLESLLYGGVEINGKCQNQV